MYFNCHYYLPLETFEQAWIFPSPYDVLRQAWLKVAQWLWRTFLKSSVYSNYLAISCPWKIMWPLIWTSLTLNFLYSMMICTKFIWNWLSGSFLKVAKLFFLFCNYIPLEIGVWLKWIPFIQEFQQNWSSSFGEKDENVENL